VARWVGSSKSSVWRWKKMARYGGKRLFAKAHPGRKRSLSKAQHRQLERLLLKGATAHGWANDLWTATRVTEMIERHFKVKLHPEHVRKIIKQRLNWTSQIPQEKDQERDEAEIKRWLREEFPRVKKTPSPGVQP
jgi:transposase